MLAKNEKVTILVVSNGYGEDQIACHLVEALQKEFPGLRPLPFPLVGEGLEYKKRGWMPMRVNRLMPSGGFIRGVGSLWGDLRSGLISQTWQQRTMLKKLAKGADMILCVGDIFCLWMGARGKRSKTFFLPTAKSDRFMKHHWIERTLMRLKARGVFARDAETAENLARKKVPARYLGNPMMDGMSVPCGVSQLSQMGPIVGLLPGSRAEALANLAHLTRVVREFRNDPPLVFVLARAESVPKEAVETLVADSGEKIVISDDFWDVVQHSRLIVGLSGTANEQAVYLGKTVICFEGFGPQSSKLRFSEQRKLLGERIVFSESREPENVAALIRRHLSQSETPAAEAKLTKASTRIAEAIRREYGD